MANDYLIYQEQTITDLSPENITKQYAQGFLFGRRHRGDMYQTRSLRIDLSQFELSSENRRVLRKAEGVNMELVTFPYPDYSWEIHQLGKTFYSQKFGDGTMSASKIKSMFVEPELNNFTHALVYSRESIKFGYCVCYLNTEMIHYTYPFYQTDLIGQTIGIAMMTKAIQWAKENGYKYIYLGSIADNTAKYKLQFSGLEWWNSDQQIWSDNIEELKTLLAD